MKKQFRFGIVVVVVAVLLAGQFVFSLTATQAANTVVFNGTFGDSTAQQDFFYRIEVNPGGSISIDLTMAHCTKPPDPIQDDPYVRLRAGSSGGTIVAENNSIQIGVNACSHLDFATAIGGVFFVEATTFRFTCGGCNGGYNTKGAFTLTVTGDLVQQAVSNSSGPAPVTFFSPGDDRIDGRPGDRVAVWCNQPGQVVVYGTVDSMPDYQKGFLLAVFKDQDLIAAGDKGLSHNAGSAGTVTISLMNGWLWVSWTGGTHNATGNNEFTKSVNFAQCAPATTGQH